MILYLLFLFVHLCICICICSFAPSNNLEVWGLACSSGLFSVGGWHSTILYLFLCICVYVFVFAHLLCQKILKCGGLPAPVGCSLLEASTRRRQQRPPLSTFSPNHPAGATSNGADLLLPPRNLPSRLLRKRRGLFSPLHLPPPWKEVRPS